MKGKFLLIGLLVSAILVSGCIQSAPSGKLDGELLKIAESTAEFEFSIYDNKIVWVDLRNGNKDIYMYDITLGKEFQITSSEKEETSPTIYGNNIVYVSCLSVKDKNGKKVCQSWALFLYNVNTTEKKILHVFELPAGGSRPIIYGNRLIWASSGKLFLLDIETGKKQEIAKISSGQHSHDIYENTIVWNDKIAGEWGIYVYDIESNETKRIASNERFQAFPKIYKDKVVWIDRRNLGDADVYLYDLTTGKERSFGGIGNQTFPDIYENKIVWSDATSYPVSLKGGRIQLYDLDREKLYYLTEELNLSSFPKIYGNNIVLQEFDASNKHWNLYLFKINTETNLVSPEQSEQTAVEQEETERGGIILKIPKMSGFVRLEGEVVDDEMLPVANALVVFEDFEHIYYYETKSDGKFLFEDLQPVCLPMEECTMQVIADGYRGFKKELVFQEGTNKRIIKVAKR